LGATLPLRYLLRDHLGSIDMIATNSGAKELQTSFAPFGERRGPNWSGSISAADVTALRDITRRGFTDHEHLGNTGLIHMNGRVYDPVIARFVSADPFIDGIANPQGWNRYSYVGNNPLSYTDPSGYLGVPNGGADGPPGGSPDPEFGNPTFCARIGGAAVCLGGGTGVGWRNDRPFARGLTWEQAFGIFHRRQRARAGTENYMPHLGSAQTLEDFGTSIDPAETLNSGLTWFGENLTPVRLFICAFDAASCTGEEAAEAAAQAAMTMFWPVRTSTTIATAASAVSHQVPRELARVVAGSRPLTSLGRTGEADVFVTAADDIAGLNATQLAERLAIDPSKKFTVIRFPTPAEGIASPVFRRNPGFLPGGLTRGGAREFVIPNGPIPAGARIEVVGP
jgi:RHS repeat-associated protein